MEDLLLIAELDTACPPSVGQMLERLRQEVAELRGEVTQLRRENLELRQQAGYWKGQHAQAVKRIEQLQQEVEQLRGENRKLQSQAFGRKTEKDASQDRSNVLCLTTTISPLSDNYPLAVTSQHAFSPKTPFTPRLRALWAKKHAFPSATYVN